jgi:hypothetical protein
MEYTDIEYELDNGEIVTLSFEAEFEAEDIGIGSYEYWGAKCRDVHWVNNCTAVDSIRVVNEEGDDVWDRLGQSLQTEIEDYCTEYANEHAPEID